LKGFGSAANCFQLNGSNTSNSPEKYTSGEERPAENVPVRYVAWVDAIYLYIGNSVEVLHKTRRTEVWFFICLWNWWLEKADMPISGCILPFSAISFEKERLGKSDLGKWDYPVTRTATWIHVVYPIQLALCFLGTALLYKL
jgi:hypothetical protein